MSDPLDLSVTIWIDAAPSACWQVLTQRLEEWWCPKPWTTELVALDLRPGGRSAMIMRGPDNQGSDTLEGVVLEVVPGERLVTTDAFRTGWIPQPPFMTGIWQLVAEGGGTRYTATARHWTDEARNRHEEMGFHPGWDVVAQQFKALCEAA